MAAFFLLLAVLVGVVLGDALVENDGAGVLTVFGQTTGRFNQGQLLLVFAGLGFLFALLLGTSLASTRGRRARRRERRSGIRELEDRLAELERDNARLRVDLGQRDDALAGREAELEHRDRQLALKDEELARRDQEPQRAHARDAAPAEAPDRATPGAAEAPDRPTPAAADLPDRPTPVAADVPDQATAVAVAAGTDQTAPAPTEVLDRAGAPLAETPDQATVPRAEGPGGTVEAAVVAPDLVLSPEAEPVAPLHDEPPWLEERAGDEEGAFSGTAGEERTRPVERGDRAPEHAPERRTEKPDQNS